MVSGPTSLRRARRPAARARGARDADAGRTTDHRGGVRAAGPRGRWTRHELAFLCWTRETGVVPAALVGVLAGLGVPDGDVFASVVALAIVLNLRCRRSRALAADRLGCSSPARVPSRWSAKPPNCSVLRRVSFPGSGRGHIEGVYLVLACFRVHQMHCRHSFTRRRAAPRAAEALPGLRKLQVARLADGARCSSLLEQPRHAEAAANEVFDTPEMGYWLAQVNEFAETACRYGSAPPASPGRDEGGGGCYGAPGCLRGAATR